MLFCDLQDASLVAWVTVIWYRTNWEHSLILKSIWQSVLCWYYCLKTVPVQKCLNFLLSTFLACVIEVPWSLFFWPQQICHNLIWSDFGWSCNILDRNKILNWTDSAIDAQIPVLNCYCQGHQLKHSIDGIKTTVRIVYVFTEPNRAFLAKSANSVYWSVLVFSSQQANVIRILNLERHQ